MRFICIDGFKLSLPRAQPFDTHGFGLSSTYGCPPASTGGRYMLVDENFMVSSRVVQLS